MTSPKNTHGGARPGAGRPPKNRKPKDGEPIFEDAESYLAAVVAGTVAADPVRVQAAKALIGYQRAKVREKVKGKTPTEINKSEQMQADAAVIEDFETRAQEIRTRHRSKNE